MDVMSLCNGYAEVLDRKRDRHTDKDRHTDRDRQTQRESETKTDRDRGQN